MEDSGMSKTMGGNARGSLTHAQAHIWNHIFSFINSMSLKCALQLGIPDIIHNHGGPMTIGELVSALSVHSGKAHCIFHLMRILVHSGFFEQTSLRVVAEDDREEVGTEHGSLIWEHMGNEPEQNLRFNNAMASDARLVATEVLGSDCKRAFEGLRSLQWIIHDWSDEESLKILKRCKDGLREGKGRKLIIVDIVLGYCKEDAESVETQLFLDMLMIVLYNAKERTEREWAKLFVEAGFRDYKITPMLGLRSLIEVYP
ncbi:hypothetical protein CRG98_041676 [Punica granatum]|uniref:O-methyltransferase domain-containing protein n=1 Tax=Punica granatum TaxID=22663 RepID=A0A2I0I284_PUNGR|nr:hypothetical protein CRG98_041676 [Punica granatum]